jgi:cytochrome c biogenesis protein CcmG/thiol:disulfide interchange protein DsbE
MDRWVKLGSLVLFAIVGTQVFLGRGGEPLATGAVAPRLALPDLGGRTVDLEELKGRVVLVNFWATWCPPCREEIPELSELWRGQRPGCFELLGVAEQSPAEELAKMSRSIPYPVLTDVGGDAAAAWKVFGFPSSFLVDTRGAVVETFQGAVSKEEVLEAMTPHLPAHCKGS